MTVDQTGQSAKRLPHSHPSPASSLRHSLMSSPALNPPRNCASARPTSVLPERSTPAMYTHAGELTRRRPPTSCADPRLPDAVTLTRCAHPASDHAHIVRL